MPNGEDERQRLSLIVPADRSSGYEGVAAEFIARRSNSRIGVREVREWARTFPRGAEVLELGCGHGIPISAALLEEGITLYGIDGSPTLVAAFRARFENTPVECSGVEDSDFFGRSFDGVVAWGLLFLLTPETQAKLIAKVANALKPAGKFVFTAPRDPCAWTDILTRQNSVSLGADAYRHHLEQSGMRVLREDDDEGQNHYYYIHKPDRS